MADTNGGDVERHFLELQSQLQEDGFDPDSQVMKTTQRLMKALRSDGFAFAVTSAETENAEDSSDVESPISEPSEEVVPDEVTSAPDDSIIRAFRTKDSYDTTVIESVFAAIDGWKTRVVEHKGNHFVIATNARLTETRIKKALVEYVTELKAASV